MTFKADLHLFGATLAFAVGLAVTTPVFAQDVTITHNQGETTISGQPERVFVTDWAAFDNLSALGVAVAGVPGSNAPGLSVRTQSRAPCCLAVSAGAWLLFATVARG